MAAVFSFSFLVVLLSCCWASLASAADAITFDGYIMTAQYRCADANCQVWALDVTRVEEQLTKPKELSVVLLELIPPTQMSEIVGPAVLTAFDNATRHFYVAYVSSVDVAKLWTVAIDDAVETATLVGNVTHVNSPSSAERLVRLHATQMGLIGVFENGTVGSIDPSTGSVTRICNLLSTSEDVLGGDVTYASTVNASTNTLYAFVNDAFNRAPYVVIIDLANPKNFTVFPVKLPLGEHYGQETIFDTQFVDGNLYFFAVGTSLGFDQVGYIELATLKTKFIAYDLMDDLMEFQIVPSLVTDDTRQTTCYDPVRKRLYFQVTQLQSADDDGDPTTTIAVIDIPSLDPVPYTSVSPFSYGYMGYTFVQIVGSSNTSP